MLSVVEAWAIEVCFKTWLNVGVGRLRPDYYASGGPNQPTHDLSEGNDARASYPSGHAAYSFGTAAVLFWWLAGRWGVVRRGVEGPAAR